VSKIDELRVKHAKELNEALQEESINAKVPPGGRVFLHRLYGTIGTLTYGDAYTSGVGISWERALTLVKALAPEDLFKVNDGSTSFQLREYVDAQVDEPTRAKRTTMLTAIAPVVLHIEHHPTMHLQLEWITHVPYEGPLIVTVHVGRVPSALGRYNAERVDYMGGTTYKKASFTPTEGLRAVPSLFVHGACVDLATPIVWSSGPDYPGRISLYFLPHHQEDAYKTGVAIVQHLAQLCAPKETT